MSVSMQDMWAARVHQEQFGHFDVKRQATLGRPVAGSGMNMADRMSGRQVRRHARLVRQMSAVDVPLAERDPLVAT